MPDQLNFAQTLALDTAMNYVLKDPAHNLAKLVDWAEGFDTSGNHTEQLAVVRPMAEDPENNWNKFVVKLCGEIDHEVLNITVKNFFVSLAGKLQTRSGCIFPAKVQG